MRYVKREVPRQRSCNIYIYIYVIYITQEGVTDRKNKSALKVQLTVMITGSREGKRKTKEKYRYLTKIKPLSLSSSLLGSAKPLGQKPYFLAGHWRYATLDKPPPFIPMLT